MHLLDDRDAQHSRYLKCRRTAVLYDVAFGRRLSCSGPYDGIDRTLTC